MEKSMTEGFATARSMTENHLATRKPYQKKTFATDTLARINWRLKYYRRVLNNANNRKDERYIEKIQKKYDRDMRVRSLLKKAVSHLYE